jgi:hypothetical protein
VNGSANVAWSLAEIGALAVGGKAADSDLLDGYDYTAFNGVVARWITSGSNAAGRLKLKLPFATNSSLMLKFTISQYSSYTQHDYEVSAYLYTTTNQWYLPRAVYTGTGSPDIVVGREADGKAYVSIADNSYTGVIVHSVTVGYTGTVPNAYDQGWVITQDATTPDSVSVDVRTTLTSSNYTSYSPSLTGAGASGTWGISITGNAGTATTLQTARTINGTSFNGSANITITANTTNTLTRGSYLTGNNFNGSAATTWAVDATSANTASKVVARDASGNFSAGTITAALSGNATTATTLETARTINGTSFNGSANITITANTTSTLTRGSYLTGNNFNGSAATTWAVDATSANTASKVVARDASGNFSAGTITAALSGNATTATTLQTARTINGTSFNGSASIIVEPYVEDAGTASATRYVTFVDNSTAGFKRLNEDADLTYNPGTNTLSAIVMSATEVVATGAVKEGYVALSGTTPSIDVDAGGGFSLTTSGNTTFTFASFTTAKSCGFVLQLTAGGTHTITWPASVDWAGGTAPDAPASGATNIYVFWSRDGGTTWYGVLSSAAAA